MISPIVSGPSFTPGKSGLAKVGAPSPLDCGTGARLQDREKARARNKNVHAIEYAPLLDNVVHSSATSMDTGLAAQPMSGAT
jgi:hypothetical protein